MKKKKNERREKILKEVERISNTMHQVYLLVWIWGFVVELVVEKNLEVYNPIKLLIKSV